MNYSCSSISNTTSGIAEIVILHDKQLTLHDLLYNMRWISFVVELIEYHNCLHYTCDCAILKQINHNEQIVCDS